MLQWMRICSFEGCGRPHEARGYCHTHYAQVKRGKSPFKAITKRPAGSPSLHCEYVGCSNKSAYGAGGLCLTHRRQQKSGQSLRPVRPRARRCASAACSYATCERSARTEGLCSAHYNQKRRGIELRPIRPRTKKGWYNHHGYRYVIAHNHPNSDAHGAIREHVLVMAEILKRPLLPHENVHHKNGDRADNRPENLELWSTSQPPGQRIEDKVAWAREILNLYDNMLSSAHGSLHDCTVAGKQETD